MHSDDVLRTAARWREEGRPAALATVVETWGSSPRPVGSQLAVDGDGGFIGSVSGGCIEGAVVRAALEVIENGRPRMLDFGVTTSRPGRSASRAAERSRSSSSGWSRRRCGAKRCLQCLSSG